MRHFMLIVPLLERLHKHYLRLRRGIALPQFLWGRNHGRGSAFPSMTGRW